MPAILVHRQVGQVVSRARKAQGLTQEQLARKAHVSRQLVNRLEMGDAANISPSRLMEVLAALGCMLRIDLEGDTESSQPSNPPERDATSPTPVEMPSYDLDAMLFEPKPREA